MGLLNAVLLFIGLSVFVERVEGIMIKLLALVIIHIFIEVIIGWLMLVVRMRVVSRVVVMTT